MTKRLTGYHVLAIAVGAFAIIIGANLAMLFAATGSFPGLVVENSYVASQDWNRRTDAQQALGWSVEIGYDGGEIAVTLTGREGAPVDDADLRLTIGRPSSQADDRELEPKGSAGVYRAPVELAPGVWRIEVRTASGEEFRTTAQLHVPEKG